jgi:hypothetical protein
MNDLADLDPDTAAFVATIRARRLEAEEAAAAWLPVQPVQDRYDGPGVTVWLGRMPARQTGDVA